MERHTKSGRLRLHTHSEQHIHSCSANQESSREKLYLLKLSEALAGCGQTRLRETFCFLRRWRTWRVGPWLGAVVWVPYKDFLKGGAETWQGRDLMLIHTWSKAANKETRIKTQFSPTESICAGRTESGTPRGYET